MLYYASIKDNSNLTLSKLYYISSLFNKFYTALETNLQNRYNNEFNSNKSNKQFMSLFRETCYSLGTGTWNKNMLLFWNCLGTTYKLVFNMKNFNNKTFYIQVLNHIEFNNLKLVSSNFAILLQQL